MHEDLVHHHLEEQRREQGEELQDEGDEQDFAEQLAVLDDGRDEPTEVEAREFAGERGARGEQDQIATPAGGKVRGGEDLRAGAAGFLDQHLAGVDAGEDEVVALVVDGQSG